jgi:hypothetical protein
MSLGRTWFVSSLGSGREERKLLVVFGTLWEDWKTRW